MQSLHFTITGKVQGVFFRASTKTKADELGITGWVKNTDSGEVEILAQGPTDKLAEFEDWCRHGPSRARVESFHRQLTEGPGQKDFTVIR